MNAHQRRKSMTRRHMDYQLGARVIVKGTIDGDLEGRVAGHIKGRDHSCWIDFTPACPVGRFSHLIPFRRMRMLEPSLRQRGERPWYRKPPWSGHR